MRSGLRRTLLSAVLLALVVVAVLARPRTVLGWTRSLLDSQYFPLLLVGLYLVRPLLAWPVTVLSVLVGFQYGLVLGVPVALAGAVGSALVPYGAVRYFDFDSGILGWAEAESDHFFEAAGDFRGLLAARIAPVPAEAASLAAGAAHVRPTVFVAGSLLGELPWVVAAVLIGHSMHRLTVGQVSFDPWLLVLTAVAGLLLLLGPTIKFVRGRSAPN